MGALLGKQRKDGERRFLGMKICQSDVEKANKLESKAQKSPKTTPDGLSKAFDSIKWKQSHQANGDKPVDYTPIPPPRKHKARTLTLERNVDKAISRDIKPTQNAYEHSPNAIPIEEPIIVPKKVPVHICDGTHHHVTNIVNGVVVHDSIISPKQNQEIRGSLPVRPKNFSTVSLPNYEELRLTEKKIKKDSTKSTSSKSKPTRHTSVVSLPTESKISLSAATAARLENYMLRCKSFGSLPPRQLLEKLESQANHASDSEDSWDGLDDWDVKMLENDGVRQLPPFEPRSHLNATPHSHPFAPQPDARLPSTIEEVEESASKKATSPILPNNAAKKTEGRRESIDDFFDGEPENPLDTSQKEDRQNESTSLGRRGSEDFFTFGYPLKMAGNNLGSKADTFYTKAFLDTESQNNHIEPSKYTQKSDPSANHAPLIAPEEVQRPIPVILEASDDLLDTFQDFYNQKLKPTEPANPVDSAKPLIEKNTTSSEDKTNNRPKTVIDSQTQNSPVQHSNLLKFLQGNSLAVATSEESAKNSVKPAHGDLEVPELLRSEIKHVEGKLHNINENSKHIEFIDD